MKRSGIRKEAKEHTMGWWKKKFWTEFSKYIRKRDDYRCFTCDNKGDGKGMHAGHFIPRACGGLSLYFHENNVHAQCYRCNINLGGNGAEYYRRMVDVYGREFVEELFRLRDTGFKKFSIEEYQELIEEYKLKTEELEYN